MLAVAPTPMNPHRSEENIVDNPTLPPPGLSNPPSVAVKLSVPCPKLLIDVKFKIEYDFAVPVTGIKVPSSCMKIPSVSVGSNAVQRIPV